LGDLAFKRGDRAAAATALERALALLGLRVPRSRVAVVLCLLWEVLVQAAHSLLPGLLVRRRRARLDRAAGLELRLYSTLAHAYWFTRERAATAWAHLREMNIAERYAPSAALAQAYAEHAPAMSLVPWHGRGIAYARRA